MIESAKLYYITIYQLMIITAIISCCLFVLKKELFQKAKVYFKYFILIGIPLSAGIGYMEYKDYSLVSINNNFIYFGMLLACLSVFIISVLNKKYGVWKIIFSIGSIAISSCLVYVAYFILTVFFFRIPYYSKPVNKNITIQFERFFLDAYGYNFKTKNYLIFEKNTRPILGDYRCPSDSVKIIYSSDDSVAFVIYGLVHYWGEYKYDSTLRSSNEVCIIADTLAINKNMELKWAKRRGNSNEIIKSLK